MPKKQKTTRIISGKKRIRYYARLAAIPHKNNQYRPHIIRRYGLAGILIAVLAAQTLYNSLVPGGVLGVQAPITSSGLLAATNSERIDHHEAPLAISAQLAEAAELKVKNMFAEQYWAHTAPDGTTPWHWFSVVGYNYSEAGENLAKDFTTSSETVAAWMASPEHRANILKGDYKDVGFAVMQAKLQGEPTTLIVALYGTPESAGVQGVTTSAPPTNEPISFAAQLGLHLQALTPAAVSSIVILLVVANIALLAHMYRRKLPVALRRGWYRHHGIYKAVGLVAVAVIIVFAYGGVGRV